MRELTLTETQQLSGGTWQAEFLKLGLGATITLIALFGQYILDQQDSTKPPVSNLNAIGLPAIVGVIFYLGIQAATLQHDLQYAQQEFLV